jgi:hypothetical protein
MWTPPFAAASTGVVRNAVVFHIARYNAGHENLQLKRKTPTASFTAKFDTASVQKKRSGFKTHEPSGLI